MGSSVDDDSQQVTQGIHCDVNTAVLAQLGSVVAGARTAFRCQLERSLSMQAAVGWPFRPAHSRTIDCTSATRALDTLECPA